MNRLRKNRRSDRNSGRIFLLSGAALIIAAALMFGGYLYDGYHTRAYGERILTELLPLIPDRVPGTVPDTIREDEQAVLEVEGVPCAGVLDIPALGKSWPVAGSYYDGSDLVRLAQIRECSLLRSRQRMRGRRSALQISTAGYIPGGLQELSTGRRRTCRTRDWSLLRETG